MERSTGTDDTKKNTSDLPRSSSFSGCRDALVTYITSHGGRRSNGVTFREQTFETFHFGENVNCVFT